MSGSAGEQDGRRGFRDAIYSQPRNLEAAREAFAAAITEVDLAPLSRGTVVLSGIGASAAALIPAAITLRAAGRRAFVVAPEELGHSRAAVLGDAFVFVSQSGASAETVRALARLEGAPAVAITTAGESPLAESAAAWLPLGPLDDFCDVATVSYTATLQALGMLCDALLGTSSGWRELPELASRVLEHADAILQPIAQSFASASAIDAVGGGAAQASAVETALLVREGLRLPSTGMETREYLHGPLEAVDDGFGCVVFGRERELELAAALASFGASVVLIGGQGLEPPSGLHVITVPRVCELATPVLQILPVQLLIERVAGLRGLAIGKLRREQADTKVA